mmetsp:Transcript_72718/g.151920  ORF Transcript_72718/g.151920 Transcript_72718/m.151920 type:complete len:144 (-) Transcript_72718:11-442(-)
MADFWRSLACCGAPSTGVDKEGNGDGVLTQRAPQHAKENGSSLKGQYGHQAGVGIIFQKQATPDPRGLLVERCSLGGPAENSRRVHHGMLLTHINDVDIRGMPANKIAPLIIGPLGSEVSLCFQDGDAYEVKRVNLTRGVLLK